MAPPALEPAVAASGSRRRGGAQAFNFALFDLLNGLALYLLAPYWIFAMLFRGKYREGVGQRFGWLPRGRVLRGCIWIHGVSVGEILAARQLIRRLEVEHPDRQVVLSTTTKTGQQVAREQYPNHYVFYYPFDLSWVLRRVLTRLRPRLIVLLELEVWPNLLRLAEAKGVPVLVLNGRLSARSFRFYSRFGRFRYGFLNRVQRYAVQTEETAGRMRRLGIEEARITITGSLKVDTLPQPLSRDARARLQERLGLREGQPVLLFGSTHAGENEALARTIAELRRSTPDLAVVWVPRHPQRAGLVEEALRGQGLTSWRLSREQDARRDAGAVVIGDTVGELASFYGVATVVFVGKSLPPEKGGQNMLEPCALGCAVAVGRNTQNFRAEVEHLKEREAIVVVQDADELTETLRTWLQDEPARRAIGDRAREAIQQLRGGTERSLEILGQALRHY